LIQKQILREILASRIAKVKGEGRESEWTEMRRKLRECDKDK